MSIHPERTFERLRYLLGGDRPSQTTRLALSRRRLTADDERQNRARVVFHQGLSSWLRAPLPFTFRHWAGVSPYMSACALAETCVFGKQSLEPMSCGLLTPSRDERKLLRLPFFRRYGVNLPSSLTEGRSFTWGEFPLPTGV